MVIELDRRFRELTERELEKPELLAYHNETPYGAGFPWAELLKRRRTVLLAEAGSGKSIEMEMQVERLRDDGHFAAYVPLEAVASAHLTAVEPEQTDRLAAWLESNEPGWLFLDSVDELRLTRGKLRRALVNSARAFDGALDRLRVIISSRPSDWCRYEDAAQFQSRFPIANAPGKEAEIDGLTAFIRAFDRERNQAQNASDENGFASKKSDFATVVLLPLGDKQMERLAAHRGAADTTAFLRTLRNEDAMAFARRPLDLIDLAAVWNHDGRLGTRIERHERNIALKLKDHPDRPDNGVLSDEKARGGVERLALALALCRRRTVLAPDVGPADDPDASVDAAHVMPDWAEDERSALLRRAVFDPATYGRVRFHHRSVQEYLAARRLQHLRDAGMGVRDMLRFLFATRYDVPIVISSMRPIAAWLAIWNADVRRELQVRSPETLLEEGDPASFDLPTRVATLRRFAEAYAKGGDRGLNVSIGEVARFAVPELGPTVRELWNDDPESPDVRELLIETIWRGPIPECADIAFDVAMDRAERPYHRIAAVRALAAVDRDDLTAPVVRSMLDPDPWPARVWSAHAPRCSRII